MLTLVDTLDTLAVSFSNEMSLDAVKMIKIRTFGLFMS